ncbi:hypothetical protein GCM10027290_16490 [Micromonospora sonneratiae]
MPEPALWGTAGGPTSRDREREHARRREPEWERKPEREPKRERRQGGTQQEEQRPTPCADRYRECHPTGAGRSPASVRANQEDSAVHCQYPSPSPSGGDPGSGPGADTRTRARTGTGTTEEAGRRLRAAHLAADHRPAGAGGAGGHSAARRGGDLAGQPGLGPGPG